MTAKETENITSNENCDIDEFAFVLDVTTSIRYAADNLVLKLTQITHKPLDITNEILLDNSIIENKVKEHLASIADRLEQTSNINFKQTQTFLKIFNGYGNKDCDAVISNIVERTVCFVIEEELKNNQQPTIH